MSSNRYGQLKCSTLEGAWGGRAESISPTPFTTLEYENIDILKYVLSWITKILTSYKLYVLEAKFSQQQIITTRIL